MKFTNDIIFNKLPRSNDILKITYSGNLFKDNSSEVYIVYGFGENWDNTTELKMEKRNYGFVANIQIKDYNTFNFCFRNSNHNWDNNNSFNYIASIFSKPLNTEVQPIDNQDAEKICNNSLDDILNSIDLELETSKTQNIELSEDLNVLDTLVQQLFEEYNAKVENNLEELPNVESASLSNETQGIISNQLIEEITDSEETSNIEYFSELSKLFDEIIQNIESKQNSQEIDLGKELNNLFENTFTENFESQPETAELYVPEAANVELNNESQELNNTFSDIVKNISEIETKTNADINNLNYDYSDFNAMFSFAQNLNTSEDDETENIFDFSNKEFDFNINNLEETSIEENIFDFSNKEFDFYMNNIEKSSIEENIFDFSNKEFDFYMDDVTESIASEIVTSQASFSNKFSDSFYDDEDISTHENFVTIEELATPEQKEAFENAINEYATYFDNLIEEIVSTPTSTLSTPVSTAQVLENENTTLAIVENNSHELTTTTPDNSIEITSDGVPNEYALYDYSSHSFFYMFKRRIKMIFSTVFSKLPKLLRFEKNSENN